MHILLHQPFVYDSMAFPHLQCVQLERTTAIKEPDPTFFKLIQLTLFLEYIAQNQQCCNIASWVFILLALRIGINTDAIEV